MSRWQQKDALFLSQPEKRNHQRLYEKIDVNLVIDGHHIDATSTNISCGGLFVPLRRSDIKPDSNCELVIHLPDTDKPVKVLGEIHRLQEGSFFSGEKRGVAIKFNELYNDNILAIDRFIKSKMN